MAIIDIEQTIIEEFSHFEDWLDRYNYLIEMGKDLPKIDERFRTDQYLIAGCQSRVWLQADFADGKIIFTADSDAVITKGIVTLLIRVLSNQRPDDVLHANLGFVDTIGLREHLSPTRSNGLNSMIKQMKLFALAFKTKEQSSK
ncbi:MAG: SufE family protein [Bacteroidetes bacterium]|nr:SufE family protein [Bacteroidota bacterium]